MSIELARKMLEDAKRRFAKELPDAAPEEMARVLAPLESYLAQEQELREHVLAAASRMPGAVAEPYPAIEYIPPRLNADDRARLHGLAVLLVDRTTEAARTMRTENLTAEGLTALAAATTAATSALLACSTDDDAKGGA